MQPPQATAQAPPAPLLDTMEILDNGLRQPLDQGRAARAEPLAVKSRAHWLRVRCVDKPGSLAEIARAIAQHEQNIKVSVAQGAPHLCCVHEAYAFPVAYGGSSSSLQAFPVFVASHCDSCIGELDHSSTTL